MNLTDVDSLVHLLQTLSWYGIPLLIVIVLCLFFFVSNKIFGVLKLSHRGEVLGYIVSSLLICLSIVLLKTGIDRDKKTISEATYIKEIALSSYTDFIRIHHLHRYFRLPKDSIYYERLIRRFPNSFSYGMLEEEKVIVINDVKVKQQLQDNIQLILPAVRSELISVIPTGRYATFDSLRNEVDSRMSYIVLESIIAKYPEEFAEVPLQTNGFAYPSLQRLK